MSETLALLNELIKKKSITPKDEGCQDLLSQRLTPLGFIDERMDFGDTQNSWLRRGESKPLLVFLGHTDVVPTGDVSLWDFPPFDPTIKDGRLYGRGTADMKGGIACFVTAVERFITQYPDHQGSIALMMTSDEEGCAVNGVVKMVEVLEQRSEKIDYCLVGEPSSEDKIGDVIKVGRRGSLCANLKIQGMQGHVAYPHKADNPIHRFAPALKALTDEVWDQGNDFFPATSLQVSNINSGTGAENIIPATVDVQFNLRFSTELNAETIKKRVHEILDQHKLTYDLKWRLSGNPFLTSEGALVKAAEKAIKKVTSLTTLKETSGGTSDGRFIAPTGAQIIELGHLNATIHQINEYIPVADLEVLSAIYEQLLIELLVKS
ncbi:MAG: succinyl-diaminopimelate desuccinylase [Methylococcales bacterium]|nr:succinyl-diaminopimelate desuccinylase [Methylococcales bacterium]